MIHKERLLSVLRAPHISEKASFTMKSNSTVVFKVAKNATKPEIKAAVSQLFEVEVRKICTLVVKGKTKRHGHHIGHRKDWKKAYVTLKKGQNLNLIHGTTE
jgi:large subunit ribosomal protein L23